MTVSTEPTTLRDAITGWRNSLTGVTGHQDAGSVGSSLLDVCIDTRVGADALPLPLRALYAEATDRVRRQSRGGYPNPFDVALLICAANEALGQL
jgi:hypothetical protein